MRVRPRRPNTVEALPSRRRALSSRRRAARCTVRRKHAAHMAAPGAFFARGRCCRGRAPSAATPSLYREGVPPLGQRRRIAGVAPLLVQCLPSILLAASSRGLQGASAPKPGASSPTRPLLAVANTGQTKILVPTRTTSSAASAGRRREAISKVDRASPGGAP